MDRAQAELDALKRTEEDLKKGHQKLEEMISRLDQEVVRVPYLFITFVFYSVLIGLFSSLFNLGYSITKKIMWL